MSISYTICDYNCYTIILSGGPNHSSVNLLFISLYYYSISYNTECINPYGEMEYIIHFVSKKARHTLKGLPERHPKSQNQHGVLIFIGHPP